MSDTGREPIADEAVFAIIAADLDLPRAKLSADSRFDRDLGLDSLDFIQLVMAVEQGLGVKLDDGEAAKTKTIADLIALAKRSPPDTGAGEAQP